MSDSKRNAYELAHLAGVASPDTPTSPGAEWLELIASAASDIEDREDISEQADSLVPIYTHNRWQVYVDLAAYSTEDPSELGATTDDMTQAAGVALFMIAERLLQALVDEDDDEDDDDDEPAEWDGVEPCYVCGGQHDPASCGICETCGDYHPADDRHDQ